MAQTVDPQAPRSLAASGAVAVVDVEELQEARSDPRVREFLANADAYLAELERAERNL